MGLINTDLSLKLSMLSTGFPSGPVVKNPLANAGDTGFDPGSGRSHMLLGNEACVPQPLSWHGAITEAFMPRACALQQNKSLQPEAYTLQ